MITIQGNILIRNFICLIRRFVKVFVICREFIIAEYNANKNGYI